MKRVLFLVASKTNLPAIKAAKKSGCYVITCDNQEDNPGHKLADKRMIMDVYDQEAIYSKIKDERIDAVLPFVSAHGLRTAAILSEKLKLKGYAPQSLETLMNKTLFREFLRANNFPCPSFKSISSFQDFDNDFVDYPCIVKPADEGGNKGVELIRSRKELGIYFSKQGSESKKNDFIVEKYLQSDKVINGDCIIKDGRVIASFIGDYIYDIELSDTLPVGTLFPTRLDTNVPLAQISEIAEKLNIPDGIINFEVIFHNGESYIIEINPRPSGNYIWKLMGCHFGVDIPLINLKLALGESINIRPFSKTEMKTNYAFNLCYSLTDKIREKKELPDEMKRSVIDQTWFSKDGEQIRRLNSLYDRAGIMLLRFSSNADRQYYLNNKCLFRV